MDPTSLSQWMPAFIQGGAFLVVAFVVYTFMHRTLPENTKHMQASQEGFLKSLAAQTDKYREEADAQRAHDSAGNERLAEAIKEQNRILERQSRILLLIFAQGRKDPDHKALSEDEREALGIEPRRPA